MRKQSHYMSVYHSKTCIYQQHSSSQTKKDAYQIDISKI